MAHSSAHAGLGLVQAVAHHFLRVIAPISGGRGLSGMRSWCYLPALAFAFIWATYSLLTKRVAAFPTLAIGLFGLVPGVLSLLCHAGSNLRNRCRPTTGPC